MGHFNNACAYKFASVIAKSSAHTHTMHLEDAPSEDKKQLLALDGDEEAGYSPEIMAKTVTYELETLGGRMLQLCRAATQHKDPVAEVCDATESLLVFNKCYGHALDIPVRNGAGVETLHLFSAVLPPPASADDLCKRFPADWLVYMPTYGGTTVSNDGTPIPKPCIMDPTTRDIMMGSGGMGWRTLLYQNQGPDDPLPTGIVAAEGWHFCTPEKGTKNEPVADSTYERAEESARAFYAIMRALHEARQPTPTPHGDEPESAMDSEEKEPDVCTRNGGAVPM